MGMHGWKGGAEEREGRGEKTWLREGEDKAAVETVAEDLAEWNNALA